jgi:hypothetical protein
MNLESFLEQEQYVPSTVEIERRKRIKIALCAYAYEFEDDPIVDDGTFDELASQIDKSVVTGNELLDKFFKNKFEDCTGQWIHQHPELDKLRVLYGRYKNNFRSQRRS